MNKKAHIIDILVWIVVGFVTLMFFALWLYAHGILTDRLIEMDTGSSIINVSEAAESTFQPVHEGLGGLRLVAFAIIFATAISILVSNFLVKAHPAFFILYIFIIVIAIIFSVYVSNTYEDLMANTVFGASLTSFTAGSFIMLHLPLWTTIIGIFGAIFLFIGIQRDRGIGGSVI